MLRRDIFKALALPLLWPFRARRRVGVDAGEGEAVTARGIILPLDRRRAKLDALIKYTSGGTKLLIPPKDFVVRVLRVDTALPPSWQGKPILW